MVGGLFKGGAKGGAFAWKSYYMGVELCVAALVECFSYLVELGHEAEVPGTLLITVALLTGMSFAFLFATTWMHNKFEAVEGRTSFFLMFVMANALGIFVLGTVLLQRGAHHVVK